ncbi:MAG: hypothetical protein JSW27_23375 [Phycisphaerales bacterium]|nr:MAG: hypothetical protein JSW27_23375 [Phycisphaerales bacterium]
MSTKLRIIALTLCLAAISLAGLAVAQGQPRARQRGNAPQGGVTEANPEMTRERMMQRMQQQLRASVEEWQVIQPRLEKVMELSRQANRRGLGALQARPVSRRRQGQQQQRPRAAARRERPDANRTPSAVEKAANELRELLAQASVTPEQVEAKLTALRQIRQTARQNLAQARAELQQVLTVKQEARLVLLGLLE